MSVFIESTIEGFQVCGKSTGAVTYLALSNVCAIDVNNCQRSSNATADSVMCWIEVCKSGCELTREATAVQISHLFWSGA